MSHRRYGPMMAVDPVLALLRERGAETIEHPGGTLYAHLRRVHDRLAGHGAPEDLRLAGLGHAVYGTDGFDVSLLELAERPTMRALVGDSAELLIYRYGACDRRRTWRSLAHTAQVWDRFTGAVSLLDTDELRGFADLSIVNELDVIERSTDDGRSASSRAEIAAKFGDYCGTLCEAWTPIASPTVIADARAVLFG
jgi:uncharacterized protein DUF6817